MSSIITGTVLGAGLVYDSDTTGDLAIKTGGSATTAATFFGANASAKFSTYTFGPMDGLMPAAQFFRLNAARVGSNLITAQSVLGKGVTLNGSTVYAFEILTALSKTAGITSSQIQFGFGGTASVTNISYYAHSHFSVISLADVSTPGPLVPFIQVRTPTPVTAATISATHYVKLLIKGTVAINAGGTFIPQYTVSAAPGGAYTTAAGSYFSIYPVGAAGANTEIGTWS